MGYIVKLGKKNMFGDDVFATKADAEAALVYAIRGAKTSKTGMRYIKAKILKTKRAANQ